jgi:hypothetical protein
LGAGTSENPPVRLREEAIVALKLARGAVCDALLNELEGCRLDVALLDDLVLEYAAHRHGPRGGGACRRQTDRHGTGGHAGKIMDR